VFSVNIRPDFTHCCQPAVQPSTACQFNRFATVTSSYPQLLRAHWPPTLNNRPPLLSGGETMPAFSSRRASEYLNTDATREVMEWGGITTLKLHAQLTLNWHKTETVLKQFWNCFVSAQTKRFVRYGFQVRVNCADSFSLVKTLRLRKPRTLSLLSYN